MCVFKTCCQSFKIKPKKWAPLCVYHAELINFNLFIYFIEIMKKWWTFQRDWLGAIVLVTFTHCRTELHLQINELQPFAAIEHSKTIDFVYMHNFKHCLVSKNRSLLFFFVCSIAIRRNNTKIASHSLDFHGLSWKPQQIN